MSCGGAAQIPCDKCLQQGKVREYEEILIEWLVIFGARQRPLFRRATQ